MQTFKKFLDLSPLGRMQSMRAAAPNDVAYYAVDLLVQYRIGAASYEGGKKLIRSAEVSLLRALLSKYEQELREDKGLEFFNGDTIDQIEESLLNKEDV